MYYFISIMVILLNFFLFSEVSVIMTTPTLVYHNEMSEYCRRQVVPSVFLSRQVTTANSHILHFSKLELPYTCYISVRTESGNNLILVTELLSNHDLTETCSKNPNQLIVYEMDETFGGYWGPLPNDLIRQEYSDTTEYYTLKTTASTITQTTGDTLNRSQNQTTPLLKTNEDFITLEVPLVNVSGSFVPGESVEKENIDSEDLFELLYNVTPWPSVKYDTSILPLVQFSINRQKTTALWNPYRKIPLQSYVPLTPDIRLTYTELTHSTVKRRPWKKQKHNVNRRLNFKKNHNLFSIITTANSKFHKFRYTDIQHPFYTSNNVNKYTKMPTNNKTKYASVLNTTKQLDLLNSNESWKLIEDLMKTLNKSVNCQITTPVNFSNILHKISKSKHNFSAYLAPNLTIYDNIPWNGLTPPPLRNFKYSKTNLIETYRSFKTTNIKSVKELFTKKFSTQTAVIKIDTDSIKLNNTSKMSSGVTPLFYTKEESSPTLTKSLFKNVSAFSNKTIFTKATDSHNKNSFDEHNVTSTATDSKITTKSIMLIKSHFTRTPKLSGLLVDHKSWENIFQSAPEMAILLNETRDDDPGHVNKAKRKRKKRKKRTINAIAIEDNRPRSLTTKATVSTSATMYNIADMQEFAQLIELKDDELHDRVALRDIQQFSGPILYNVCDSKETGGRGVFLFNASRIVLFIGNFSMQGMTVILTPARTLLTGDSHCSPSNIECQVSGARVCIDSLATCDGIPNCGSYDIYDEDRLMCGGSLGMLHNIYLAAFTFLAVMLTMLYIVHYWLKQYVPKVSEAFFIYINGIENILYLDTIMRHPNENENDDVSKLVYRGDIFEDDILYATDNKTNKINLFSFLKNIFTYDCLRKKRPIQDHTFFSTFPETELQYIQKESADTAVQTGESLEMAYVTKLKNRVKQDSHNNSTLPPISEIKGSDDFAAMLDATLSENNLDELSMLKFFRKSRSESISSNSFDSLTQAKGIPVKISVTTLEKEIIIYEYDRPSPETAGPSTKNYNFADNSGTPQRQKQTKKKLRFNEEATIIPSIEFGETGSENSEDKNHRRGIELGKRKEPNCNKIESYNNSGRSFWGKCKKQKRRKQH